VNPLIKTAVPQPWFAAICPAAVSGPRARRCRAGAALG